MKISVCAIMKNEMHHIVPFYESVSGFADEIIILDTGSTDGSVNSAQELGMKIFRSDWSNSFSRARNEALKYTQGDWIFVLDLDERMVNFDKKAFLSFSQLNEVDAYQISIKNHYDDNSYSSGEVLRLFRKNHPGAFFVGDVHEQLQGSLEGSLSISTLPNTSYITHLGYQQNEMAMKDKLTRNKTLLKKQLDLEPHNPFHQFNYGMCFVESAPDIAINYFSMVIDSFEDKAPYTDPPLYFLATLIYSLKLIENKGETIYHDILNLGLTWFPNSPDLNFLLGKEALKIGQQRLALQAFERAIAPNSQQYPLVENTEIFSQHFQELILKLKNY
jgi:glycosyltransferase involved in cell wall biosynthesis